MGFRTANVLPVSRTYGARAARSSRVRNSRHLFGKAMVHRGIRLTCLQGSHRAQIRKARNALVKRTPRVRVYAFVHVSVPSVGALSQFARTRLSPNSVASVRARDRASGPPGFTDTAHGDGDCFNVRV